MHQRPGRPAGGARRHSWRPREDAGHGQRPTQQLRVRVHNDQHVAKCYLRRKRQDGQDIRQVQGFGEPVRGVFFYEGLVWTPRDITPGSLVSQAGLELIAHIPSFPAGPDASVIWQIGF